MPPYTRRLFCARPPARRCAAGLRPQPGLKHRLQTIRLGPTQRVQLHQGGHTGLKAGQLVRLLRFANAVLGGGQIHQRQTRQGLQQRVQVEHLAAFAPCAIKHDQTQLLQLSGLHPQRRQGRGRVQWQLRIGGTGWVQQNAALIGGSQPLRQLGRGKALPHFESAAWQAQMQQPGGVFGVAVLQGVLQDQQLNTTSHRLHQGTKAMAARA